MKTTTLFTYPWDLHDEGVDRALDFIVEKAGFNSLCLALSYHIATYFLPHNPRRKIYYGDHGALYFQPQQGLYASTALKPQVSPVVGGDDYMEKIRQGTSERGIEFCAWIVYFYNHHLARSNPGCAKVDVFGNPYLSLLCPANPDVRAYALALTHDIVSNFRPQAVNLESLSYRHFDYGFLNPKILVEMTPLQKFLMGLCFCPHCVHAANEIGMDGTRCKQLVAECLEESLPRDPHPNEMKPLSDELLDDQFGGELRKYLEARSEVAISLFKEIVTVIRSYGDIKIQMCLPKSQSGNVTGLPSSEVHSLLDRTFESPPLEVSQWDRYFREKKDILPSGIKFLPQIEPDNLKSESETTALIKVCQSSEFCDGLAFYNYGLARKQHLQWIGSGLALT